MYMKQKSSDLVDEFSSTAVKRNHSLFQLIKCQDGMYHIKRGSSTLVVVQEEAKARKGFKTLREKWSVGEEGSQ